MKRTGGEGRTSAGRRGKGMRGEERAEERGREGERKLLDYMIYLLGPF